MRQHKHLTFFLLLLVFACLAGTSLFSCRETSTEGMVVLTRVPVKQKNGTRENGNQGKYIPEAQIVALNLNQPATSPVVLTVGYYSAQSPAVSFDGTHLLFAAQKEQRDTWQIYEMKLSNAGIRQITHEKENCIDPAYLPGDLIVFSKAVSNDPLQVANSLYTCNLSGQETRRITFNPHNWFGTTVLKDGRLLTISKQISPEVKRRTMMVLRPDGTKSELFYDSPDSHSLISRATETPDGKIVGVEDTSGASGEGKLFSLNYNSPYHSKLSLSEGIRGDFREVTPLATGNLLVCYRPFENEHFGLYEFDPTKKLMGKAIYAPTDFEVIEAVAVFPRERPRKLPSEVDMGVKTGLLLCQDINFSDPASAEAKSVLAKAASIEVMGIDSSLGVVPTAADGSVYLKIKSDTPFKIRLLGKDGTVLNKSCDWIWLRPNERRGCVGCHENPEQVPENKVPLAVKSNPVPIPVQGKKLHEKKVLLE